MKRSLAMLIAIIMGLATLVALAMPSQAAERAYFRIVDHPRVEKFVTSKSPAAPWLLKTRIDAQWNPAHTGEVRISIQIVRLVGKKWVAAGPPTTESVNDGNITVYAEGVAQPGRHIYAAQWNADAMGAPGKGILPYKRPNERGPGREFTAPGKIVLPGPVPTIIAPTPLGCVQKIEPGTKNRGGEFATARGYSGCPGTPHTSALSQRYEIQRCLTGGVVGCVTGWVVMDSNLRIARGPLPRTTYAEISHDIMPTPWRYRVLMQKPIYRQNAFPPRTQINIVAPDVQVQYVISGSLDPRDNN